TRADVHGGVRRRAIERRAGAGRRPRAPLRGPAHRGRAGPGRGLPPPALYPIVDRRSAPRLRGLAPLLPPRAGGRRAQGRAHGRGGRRGVCRLWALPAASRAALAPEPPGARLRRLSHARLLARSLGAPDVRPGSPGRGPTPPRPVHRGLAAIASTLER